ncbi:hypothetical protein ATY27_17290 [Rheinheimera sp. F8]|nr:hypothetical protein ATY27_17290 [Rheinheimera sp. F8]
MYAMVDQVIQQIHAIESQYQHDVSVIQALEGKLETLASGPSLYNLNFLLYRNHFRTKHAAKLKIKRPRILLGLINYDVYPNFQSIGLLIYADVVSLSVPHLVQGRADRLAFDISIDDLAEAIQRLPAGFTPEYYFDPQACGASIAPKGLERLPFPSVAGVCHTFRGLHCEYLAKLFDVVAPVSSAFVPLYQSLMADKTVLSLPFGANWGSFHYSTGQYNLSKDIDLIVSFGESPRAEYGGWRDVAMQLAHDFAKQYANQYKVVFVSGVSHQEYSQLLARSKIGLNVVGFNGPYNYRSCELMNHQVALLQLDVDFGLPQMQMADYFVPGQEYIACDVGNFSETLLRYLQQPALITKIATAGRARLEREYSYEAIQRQLGAAIGQLDFTAVTAARQDAASQRPCRLAMLATSPQGHTLKHQIFAREVVEGFDETSPRAIRQLIIALPMLKQDLQRPLLEQSQQTLLRRLVCLSLLDGIETLSMLLPQHSRVLSDEWTLICWRANSGYPNIDDLQSLLFILIQSPPEAEQFPDYHNAPYPFLFSDSDMEAEEARKRLLDMPYCLVGGDRVQQKMLQRDYMVWWCQRLLDSAEPKSA